MTLPKSLTLTQIHTWFQSPLGLLILGVLSAGCIALASRQFVTHEALAKDVSLPLAHEVSKNQTQDAAIATVAELARQLEEKRRDAADREREISAATAAANAERDKAIRALAETTQTLAAEVRTHADKARAHEAQIIALQTATAGVRTEIAVVQANQIAAAKQSDRIEVKLDRLIEGRKP